MAYNNADIFPIQMNMCSFGKGKFSTSIIWLFKKLSFCIYQLPFDISSFFNRPFF